MPPAPMVCTPELAAEICAHIASGMSLRTVCKQPGIPSMPTIFGWLAREPSFAEQYARAKSAQADALADEILEIADDTTDDPNSRRVRVDTRKWLASKLRPKKYGEFQVLEVTGADGGPIDNRVQVVFVDATKQMPVSENSPKPALSDHNR